MLNKLIDHHMHSNYSPDSIETIENIIKRAIELGVNGIMLTDHVEIDCPDPNFRKIIDYQEYINKIKHLNKTNQIEILMGVELGYQSHVHSQILDLIKKHPFDFIICSIHYCDGLDFCNGDFFKNRTQFESYKRYYEVVYDTVRHFDNYDVFGHLDFILRYGDRSQYSYNDYKEIIDQILSTLIKKGKGIEINTSGYRYKLNTCHPSKEILLRYKELGGEIITLGSDAHKATDLQANFNDAIKILKEIGYNYITTFKNRKASFIKIT